MQKRLNIFFSGTVQGVGFRFTTERIARDFRVSGFVRNLPGGKVQAVAEGEEGVLKNFLQAVCDSPLSRYIEDVETQWAEAEGKFAGFRIVA